MSAGEKLVDGRYRLLGRIGRGAMSVVWQARDERLNRLVALKELRQDAGVDEAAFFRSCARAVREARMAARLKHAHAVTVFDVIESAGSVYVVMEYLPSRSLTDLVLEHGRITPEEAARLGKQIAPALAAAHAAGILHRDVTPNNILVTDDGTAKIVDFGVSRAVGDATRTGTGRVVGTVAYLAPEVAAGGEGSFPADVYALGATLYTALEGSPPYGTDDNPVVLLERIAHDEPTPPRHAGPLTDVLLRMTHRDPTARPAMAEVEALLSFTPPAEAPPRRRRVALVAGLAAVGVVAATAVLGTRSDPAPVSAPLKPATTTVTSQETVRTTSVVTPTSPRPTVVAERNGCSARYEVTSSWPGGDQVKVRVRNDGTAAVAGWTVTWPAPAGIGVQNLWDGVLDGREPVTVRNAAWNGRIAPGGTISFGFNETVTGGRTGPPVLTCRGGAS